MLRSIKHIFILLLRRAIHQLLSLPYLSKWAIVLGKKLPERVQARLRRAIATGSTAIPNVSDGTMSRLQALFYRDLKHRIQAHRTHGAIKPRLAYFSPLPPLRSGIANYSMMLVPRLAEHYRLELIVNQDDVEVPWSEDDIPVRSVEWFIEHAAEFDRILYHFGNSPFHSHMFELLEKWPGTVVLHDFYLADAVAYVNSLYPGYRNRVLYRQWGYPALQHYNRDHNREALDYCLNGEVIEHARGLIVHSPFSIALANKYCLAKHGKWHVIPHLREVVPNSDALDARRVLGLPEDSFVVCSFGHLVPTKLHDRLVDSWLASDLSENEKCLLVFVGEKPSGSYGENLLKKIASHPAGKRIRITGWANTSTFDLYLTAADMAVQLRSHSRGETSGAVIDCLNHGLPTIVNANGTMADLPENSVKLLEDKFSDEDLTNALESLWLDADLRISLGSQARATIRQNHDPAICGSLYHEAIEASYHAYEQNLGKKLDSSLAAADISNPESPQLTTLAAELALARETPPSESQLLVDVSAIVHTDLKTGIQRVVRAQLLELFREPLSGFRVEPVYLDRIDGCWNYRYARRYTCELLNAGTMLLPDEKIDVAIGDILYVPDFHPNGVAEATQEGLYRFLKNQGVSVNMLIHDLLPVTMPHHFPPDAPPAHQRWLSAIIESADQLICISDAVAKHLHTWITTHHPNLDATPRIVINHHGADITASLPSKGLPGDASRVLEQLKASPTFIMVGTIEPRKGHLQTLAAFNQLWDQGLDINLVVVGKKGWNGIPKEDQRTIPDIARHLNKHPQRHKKLFWLADISDEYLEALYAASDCLIAASEDEGFGLPLIEAGLHGLPILARDIPVFQEVAGEFARYFSGNDPDSLANSVTEWLELRSQGQIPDTAAMPIRTWQENVADLKNILLTEQRFY